MKANIRLIARLISCAAVAAAGLFGIWCFRYGLLDPHRSGAARLLALSYTAPFGAVFCAIVAIIFRNKNNG
jgi:hypothetical protein